MPGSMGLSWPSRPLTANHPTKERVQGDFRAGCRPVFPVARRWRWPSNTVDLGFERRRRLRTERGPPRPCIPSPPGHLVQGRSKDLRRCSQNGGHEELGAWVDVETHSGLLQLALR